MIGIVPLGLAMNKTIIASILAGVCFTSFASNAQHQDVSTIFNINELVPASASMPMTQWLPLVLAEIEKLPEIAVINAQLAETDLAVKAAQQAIYNPELGMNYTNADTDSYALELSQTIDWGDQRGGNERVAQLESLILQAETQVLRSQILAERLLALVNQQQANKQLLFAKKQQQYGQTQQQIAEQQVNAGAISQVELQLIKLELANNAAEYALAEQAAMAADNQVLALFADSPPQTTDFMALIADYQVSQVDGRLPALTSAYQQVLLAKASANLVKAQTGVDPTISLSAEREGDENKFGVGVSIPLQVRNSFDEQYGLALQQVVIAEQAYLAKERVLTLQQRQFSLTMPRLISRYHDWQLLVEQSGMAAADALQQQWRSGDINTSDYLQSRRQIASSYFAGLQLEQAIYQNWLTWMGDSGELYPFVTSKVKNHAVGEK